MKVSPTSPFQIIYSIYQHEYLGFLFDPYVMQLDQNGKMTLSNQNISSKNAIEFQSRLDEKDFQIISLTDEMHIEYIAQKFGDKNLKSYEFLMKVYHKEKGNKLVQDEIQRFLEIRRAEVLSLIGDKYVFEMGNDGFPAWKKIDVLKEQASVLFHFRKNEDNTHYFPTIKLHGEKLDFQYKNSLVICNSPAWMIVDSKLFTFQKKIEGNKIKPFLNKKFIVIPKKIEDTYYRKFIPQLVSSFDVYAKGFDIKTKKVNPCAILNISEIRGNTGNPQLFDVDTSEYVEDKILLELFFQYGDYRFKADRLSNLNVKVEQDGNNYTFYRIIRDVEKEREYLSFLRELALNLKNAYTSLPKSKAFEWISNHKERLIEKGINLQQGKIKDKKYFIGKSSISIKVNEEIDWFDINAVIKFGPYEITFKTLRKQILAKKHEIALPNGEVAVIPESWFTEYSELFNFSEANEKSENLKLKKHHLMLVDDLRKNNLAKVSLSRKLQNLKDFTDIKEASISPKFKGELRPYQKAGYNWLSFLKDYNFGGCLADDMGLGKTIQTLALLQGEKDENPNTTSLLIMPTSLIYNWEMEAKKFTPDLKVLVYVGSYRKKDSSLFANYDLVLTSYGITRVDQELFKGFYFNYIILDEAQVIKNPSSNISKTVRKLKSKRKLVLTGTPVENSTMDLWSQISFVNPGLLGSQSYFKNHFLNPIEKNKDEEAVEKLNKSIKPFILRREKRQVVTELPEKIESIQYCNMTEEQNEIYEEVKSSFRNKILEQIENDGINNAHFMLLQGLTKLRQIANHPLMVDENYGGSSGKIEDVIHMINNALVEDHNLLVFSQFVKHLSIVAKYLNLAGVKFKYLDGSSKNRMELINDFQNNDKIKIFLISLKAGGMGINLTKADYVFILDPWWNPAIEAQAVDRAHRIGQKNQVFTYKFITRNTVEEKILTLQQRKKSLVTSLVKTEENFFKSLSRSDVETILD